MHTVREFVRHLREHLVVEVVAVLLLALAGALVLRFEHAQSESKPHVTKLNFRDAFGNTPLIDVCVSGSYCTVPDSGTLQVLAHGVVPIKARFRDTGKAALLERIDAGPPCYTLFCDLSQHDAETIVVTR